MGALSGRDTGLFDPQAPYTRAEAMQVIANLTADILDAGVQDRTYDNTLILRSDDVTLKDTTVSGDLIVAQGVGDGDVTLDGVTVTGRRWFTAAGKTPSPFTATATSRPSCSTRPLDSPSI